MTDEQAVATIEKISSNKASCPDGVSTFLLKPCSRDPFQPIKLIWAESFAKLILQKGKYLPLTSISPIYKSGNRGNRGNRGNCAEAINYRPIAFTSQIINIYERYFREVVVK